MTRIDLTTRELHGLIQPVPLDGDEAAALDGNPWRDELPAGD